MTLRLFLGATGTSNVAGAVAGTQAAQTAAIAAKETIKATVAGVQAVQTASMAGIHLQDVTATLAGTQAAQSGAVAATETFSAVIAAVQQPQSGSLDGIHLQDITATLAGTQARQTAAMVGIGGIVRVRHYGGRAVRREQQVWPWQWPVYGEMHGEQPAPSASLAAQTNDDELAIGALVVG